MASVSNATIVPRGAAPADGLGWKQSGSVIMMGNDTPAMVFAAKIVNTAPAQPFICNSDGEATKVYVDDSDDSGPAAWCICVATSDNGSGTPSNYDWRREDDTATACPFF